MSSILLRNLALFGGFAVVLTVALVVVAQWPIARAGGDLGAPTADAPLLRFPEANAYVLVELARTAEERQQGLMGRSYLEEGTGMLFVFAETVSNPFWMKNTLIPLSIAFIDARGVIVDIQDMQPLDEALHVPAAPYRYALEVPQGWFGREGVRVGQSIELPAGL